MNKDPDNWQIELQTAASNLVTISDNARSQIELIAGIVADLKDRKISNKQWDALRAAGVEAAVQALVDLQTKSATLFEHTLTLYALVHGVLQGDEKRKQ